jgi:transposase-like protein
MASTSSTIEGNGATEWAPPSERLRWGEAEGRAMVEAWRRSGDSPAVFARRHGLEDMRVRRWIARVGRTRVVVPAPKPTITFAPVQVVEATRPVDAQVASLASTIEVVVGRAVVRVAAGFDEALLRQVLVVLAESTC